MIGGDAETLSALEVGVLCNNASLGLDGREAENPAIYSFDGFGRRPQKQACTERGYDFRWIHRLSKIY